MMGTHETQFVQEHKLEGLTQPTVAAIIAGEEGYTIDKAKQFLTFQNRINEELLKHPIILKNDFCEWFAKGEQTQEQIKSFVVQFSVFSNLFLIAQLNKVINADSLEGMRASKEILANELGVIFNAPKDQLDGVKDEQGELVSTQGSVDGGLFKFQAAHFEWLLRLGDKLNLGFADMGKRRHGTAPTLFFCDELNRLYGSDDYQAAQASSYAVENWAAAGFWDQLVQGFEAYNEKNGVRLPLSFFSWHAKIEAQHAAHTQEELEELYFTSTIDEDLFIKYGNEMLEGVKAFWVGLEQDRLSAA